MINQYILKQNTFLQEGFKKCTSTLGIQVPQEPTENLSYDIGNRINNQIAFNRIQNNVLRQTRRLSARHKLYQYNACKTIRRNHGKTKVYLGKIDIFEEVA
jgi:hypothetical protein